MYVTWLTRLTRKFTRVVCVVNLRRLSSGIELREGDSFGKGALEMRFFVIFAILTSFLASLLAAPAFAAPAFPVAIEYRVGAGSDQLGLNAIELHQKLEGKLSNLGWDLREPSGELGDDVVSLQLVVVRSWAGVRQEFSSPSF